MPSVSPLSASSSASKGGGGLGVRASSGYTLFEVQTTTALTVPNEPLVVSNSTESAAGQRPNEMVLFVKG